MLRNGTFVSPVLPIKIKIWSVPREKTPTIYGRRKCPHFGSQFKGPERQHGTLTGTLREKEDDSGRRELC